jgi:surface polysaccharide O-acyltransferase-like enzyme
MILRDSPSASEELVRLPRPSPATPPSGPIPPDTSARITMLRFPLMIGVVLIHAYGDAANFSGATIDADTGVTGALFVQNLISQVLARSAVPLFFAISGLLFFAGFEFTAACITRKLKSRVNTLLIPYLVWNTAIMGLFFTVQSVPSLADFLSGRTRIVADFTPWRFLNAYVGYHDAPIADHLWFIRDLMILVVIAPILGLPARRAPKLALAGVMALLVNKDENILGLLSYEALGFFFLGAVISLQRWNPCRLDRFARLLVPASLGLAVLDASLMTAGSPHESLNHSPTTPFHLSTVLLGIAAVWILAGRLAANPRISRLLSWLAPFAFFVFVAHEPLLGAVRKLLYKALVPSNSWEVTLVYLLAPTLVVSLTLFAGWTLKRLLPGVYGAVTGNRA